ncbi:hypothetical protein B0H19DRAFT_1082007 [Mycena capillaripes]|nr:hypothetical protein B0H19DRAFT_1082007 [Mycena capillaripes]
MFMWTDCPKNPWTALFAAKEVQVQIPRLRHCSAFSAAWVPISENVILRSGDLLVGSEYCVAKALVLMKRVCELVVEEAFLTNGMSRSDTGQDPQLLFYLLSLRGPETVLLAVRGNPHDAPNIRSHSLRPREDEEACHYGFNYGAVWARSFQYSGQTCR